MGKIISVMSRKANRFNVEARAEKIISKDKQTAAPKFPSNVADMDRVLKVYPDFVAQQNKRHTELDDRLKKVFVTSTKTTNEEISPADPNKPLPLDRKPIEEMEYGFKFPEDGNVTRGKCTLKQALQFLGDHQADPKLWNNAKVAEEYKLKEEVVANVLHYFKTFQIHIPNKGGKTSILAQPELVNKMLDEPVPQNKEKPNESRY